MKIIFPLVFLSAAFTLSAVKSNGSFQDQNDSYSAVYAALKSDMRGARQLFLNLKKGEEIINNPQKSRGLKDKKNKLKKNEKGGRGLLSLAAKAAQNKYMLGREIA